MLLHEAADPVPQSVRIAVGLVHWQAHAVGARLACLLGQPPAVLRYPPARARVSPFQLQATADQRHVTDIW